jgi:hypothetical protein
MEERAEEWVNCLRAEKDEWWEANFLSPQSVVHRRNLLLIINYQVAKRE